MSLPARGAEIRRLRNARGWSQTDLASKAGLSANTVQNAEAGKAVAPGTIQRLAEVFAVPSSDLIVQRRGGGLELEDAHRSILEMIHDRVSVNLVASGSSRWREVIATVRAALDPRALAVVDMSDPNIVGRADLVSLIETQLIGAQPTTTIRAGAQPADDLVRLKRCIMARSVVVVLIVTHFDHIGLKPEAFREELPGLLGALRNLTSDEKRLTLLVQSHRPYTDLIRYPDDDIVSSLDLHQVRLNDG